jgi:hypothetical protein
MIDAFSSYVECVPTPNKEAATIYQAFLRGWVAQCSFCDRLNSDLGSEFHNGLFKELSAKIGFKHTFSSVAHPNSNGQVKTGKQEYSDVYEKVHYGKWSMGVHVTSSKICVKFRPPCHLKIFPVSNLIWPTSEPSYYVAHSDTLLFRGRCSTKISAYE